MEHFIVVRNRNINKTFENVFVRFLCVHKNRMKVLKKEPNFGSAKQKYMAVESWSQGNEYNNKMSAKKNWFVWMWRFSTKYSINLCIAAHEFSNDYVVVDGMSCPSFFDSLLPFFFDRIEKFICYSTVCTQNTRLFPVLTVVSIRGCVQRVVFFPASCVWVNLVNLFPSICPHYFIVWYTVHEELHSTQKRWEFQSDTNRTCTIDQNA